MTSADRKDLMPAQEKLEWVTPQIALMNIVRNEGSGKLLTGTELIAGEGPS